MVLKKFEEYIKEGIVKKITPDLQRAYSLKEEAEKKFNFLKKLIQTFGITNNYANEYIEYCYNIIMFLIRSEMFKEGFSSSGKGAHEAEVSYAEKLGLKENELILLDQLRYFRNGILYYGKEFDKEYAEQIITFTKNIYKKLK